ncbi:MAG: radical SAM family heme chaperone HemW [Lachnospiraceae bacterium]|nr:radical SAM family heme chaperone HemW [Lachnospiraceae bacterium]
MKKAEESLRLYLHIPFCVRKCLYCDFLSAPATETVQRQYVDALIRELRAVKENAENDSREGKIPLSLRRISSIYIGGGTPSILPCGEIERIMETVYSVFAVEDTAEISMELNPGTISDKQLLQSYRRSGINRLSIGLQSTVDSELRALGRIHTWQDFCETYDAVRQSGFQNINVDLMAAIPGQDLASYLTSLHRVISLKPEHISAYSLIVEENTPFYEQRDMLVLPSEEEEREMYEQTKQVLSEAGYERYEISNYARKGYECRHNTGYWRRDSYLGFGIGAASLIDNTRFHNTEDLEKYLNSSSIMEIREDEQVLTGKDQMEEFMFLGLRMTEGISKKKFQDSFAVSIDEIYATQLDELEKEGLLYVEKDRIRLTKRGLDLSNVAMAEFLF